MTYARTALPVLAAAVIGITSTYATQAQSAAMPYLTISAGVTEAFRQPTQIVIRDVGAWQTLWTRTQTGRGTTAPPVDFARDMVVAMFAGTTTGVRTLMITRVSLEADAVVVAYVLRQAPSPNAEPTVLRPAPYHIIRTDRSTLPVRFVRIKSAPIVPQP